MKNKKERIKAKVLGFFVWEKVGDESIIISSLTAIFVKQLWHDLAVTERERQRGKLNKEF